MERIIENSFLNLRGFHWPCRRCKVNIKALISLSSLWTYLRLIYAYFFLPCRCYYFSISNFCNITVVYISCTIYKAFSDSLYRTHIQQLTCDNQGRFSKGVKNFASNFLTVNFEMSSPPLGGMSFWVLMLESVRVGAFLSSEEREIERWEGECCMTC
jgi:hypothetical protein